MPEDMPDRMPDRMPEDNAKIFAINMPDRMPYNMAGDIQEKPKKIAR